MKRLIALLLVLSVILVACGEKTTVTQVQTSGVNEKTSTAAPAETKTAEQPKAAQPNMDALTLDGNECLKEDIKVCLPVNYAIAGIGDTVGFAFGVANQLPQEKKIALKVKFVRTQQTLGELAIEEDKNYMQKWLSVNDLEPYYTLQPHEKLSKPILVKIGNSISDTKSTVPGAYVFEVQAQTYENGFYENYGGAQQFTVRVK
jgi:hypothetical protein